MSAPVRVAVAVSNSNTSSDKTRLGKGISRTLAKQSFKLWQGKVSSFGKAEFQALAKQCFKLWQGKVSSFGKAKFQALAKQSFKLWQSRVSDFFKSKFQAFREQSFKKTTCLAGEIAKNRALLGRFSPPNKSGFHREHSPFGFTAFIAGDFFRPHPIHVIPVFSFWPFHSGKFCF